VIEVEVFGAGGDLSPADVRRLSVEAAAAAGVHRGHLAVEFVDAERITALNGEHRGKPAPTDVLSFPVDGAEPLAGVESSDDARASPAGREGLSPRELGDVVICPEHTTDLREAVIHGVLHLVGMDHETDDGAMLALQQRLLDREGQ
jgi:probable rRNA maturation factor